MKQYITASRLVTKIKMLRSGKAYKGVVVVEGATDYRLYGKFINQEGSEIIIADSKSNVIQCVEACNHERLQGIIGIADADFWRLEHHPLTVKNLFLTDYHDLECMLIHSPAYESILAEYASHNKFLRFEERKKTKLKTLVLKNAAKIGYLRWYSLLNNLGLRFSSLDFSRFVNQTELEVDLVKLIDYVLLDSKKQHMFKTDKILKEIEKLTDKEHNLWDVCCGHDMIDLLSIGLIHIFGEYNAKNLFPGNLEGSFRLAYEYNYFLSTELYRSLAKWQASNSNYAVLGDKAIQAIV